MAAAAHHRSLVRPLALMRLAMAFGARKPPAFESLFPPILLLFADQPARQVACRESKSKGWFAPRPPRAQLTRWSHWIQRLQGVNFQRQKLTLNLQPDVVFWSRGFEGG